MAQATPSTNSLAAGIAALAPDEGCNRTRHPGVVLYRMTVAEPPTPILYPSSLILVGAGEKQATLGDQTYTYNPGHYLVVTPPLPMHCRTIASVARPVLTLQIELDLAQVRELVLELDPPPARPAPGAARSVFRAALTRELEQAGARLLACLADERRARVLARQTIREMLFLVLEGPYGDSVRALAVGPTSQLAHVLRHMTTRFAERIPIGELAKLARMSVPTFHQHFKTTTGTSPLQYIKAVRLTRARQLLQDGGLVKSVAHEVGYESESQFSREYRRYFGAAPSARSHPAPRDTRAPRRATRTRATAPPPF